MEPIYKTEQEVSAHERSTWPMPKKLSKTRLTGHLDLRMSEICRHIRHVHMYKTMAAELKCRDTLFNIPSESFVITSTSSTTEQA